jgi:indolepyruvate ferredoxin oxidoreductase, beta subunit
MRRETVTLLIAAMGGEGGGVLSNWLVRATRLANRPVQLTSIPGVAQRTGATTYYIEIGLEKTKPTFCLTPMAGDVDIMLATELLETGRAIAVSFITPDKTLLIASNHRVYTVAEKSSVAYENQRVETAITKLSRENIIDDFAHLALLNGSSLNAVMLGVLAKSNALVVDKTHFIQAISDEGIAVKSNLKGFEAGYDYVKNEMLKQVQHDESIINIGKKRLALYQNAKYAALYEARLKDFPQDEVARVLALRMSFEDIMYVAGHKISPTRFATIRNEMMLGDKPHIIRDHFKPGLEELASLLPPRLGQWLVNHAIKHHYLHKTYVSITVNSTSIFGFLKLYLIAKLKFLRPYGWRYKQENQQIETWLSHIKRAQTPELAHEITLSAELIKGYSDTLKRGLHNYEALEKHIILPALHGTMPIEKAVDAMISCRLAAVRDPEGEGFNITLQQVLSQ